MFLAIFDDGEGFVATGCGDGFMSAMESMLSDYDVPGDAEQWRDQAVAMLMAGSVATRPAIPPGQGYLTITEVPCVAPVSGKQRNLFSGMDCLPGQMDLFDTDGGSDEDD